LEAIHVNVPDLTGSQWEECSDDIGTDYIRETRDTMPIFDNIISKAAKVNPPLKLRFLIYNGDADGVCNFLGGNLKIVCLFNRKLF
jgi:carboxypeptidase C (cathepsin A)